ncbi:MAG: hypothetical protein WDZ51_03845 [Pirellulaceae bacterium]
MNADTLRMIHVLRQTENLGFADGSLADVAEFLASYHHDGADYHPLLSSIDFWAVDWLAVASEVRVASC